LGIRSHAKGTFHEYVEPGHELETAQMHRVAANKLIFNITFAWEHAVLAELITLHQRMKNLLVNQ
jgi:type I restriction enzyme S subunit